MNCNDKSLNVFRPEISNSIMITGDTFEESLDIFGIFYNNLLFYVAVTLSDIKKHHKRYCLNVPKSRINELLEVICEVIETRDKITVIFWDADLISKFEEIRLLESVIHTKMYNYYFKLIQ